MPEKKLPEALSATLNKKKTRVRVTTATLAVLSCFLEAIPNPLAGSDIINETRIFSGTLYPLLDRLEKAGLLEGSWEQIDPMQEGRPRRKHYRLTPEGAAFATRELERRQTNKFSVIGGEA